MIASIISVGQELLIGDTINTNASWMGRFLSENAIECRKVITIGDDAQMIARALDQTLKSSDLVIMTGGLGPTHDDITKVTLAEYFGASLVRHEPSFTMIRDMFAARNMPFSDSNFTQADVLDNAQVLVNKAGTAPGMWIDFKGRILVVLPGVPREMKYLMTHEVMPRLKIKNGGTSAYYAKYIQICGIGESNLSDLVLGDLSRFLHPKLTLAFLPHNHDITLRISSYARTDEEAREQASPLVDFIRKQAAEFIYSEAYEESLEAAVVGLLAARKATVATAESCTGGLLSHLITNVSGSSAVFNGGFVTYSNELKTKLLDVPPAVLEKFGAVSKETALIMAQSVAEKLGADFGIATTGIAGPTGGTPEKPVGTVWIAFWSGDTHFAVKAQLFKDRILNKERTAGIALDILRRQISGISTFPYTLKPEFPT